MNPAVTIQCIQRTVKEANLSWDMVEDRDRKFVVKILRTIEDLDEDQCNTLYQRIDGMTPIVMEMKIRDIKTYIYDRWIMKCMSHPLALFVRYWSVFRKYSLSDMVYMFLVSADIVGGEHQYGVIRNEFNAMYQSALNEIEMNPDQKSLAVALNQKCYCQGTLERKRWDEADGWGCTMCGNNQYGRISFVCTTNSCLFKRVAGRTFYICPSCFNRNDDISNDSMEIGDEDDRKDDGFICLKLQQNITSIS